MAKLKRKTFKRSIWQSYTLTLPNFDSSISDINDVQIYGISLQNEVNNYYKEFLKFIDSCKSQGLQEVTPEILKTITFQIKAHGREEYDEDGYGFAEFIITFCLPSASFLETEKDYLMRVKNQEEKEEQERQDYLRLKAKYEKRNE